MKSAVVGAVILAALFGFSGCGQRGPLYLPGPATTDTVPDKPASDGVRR